MSLGDTVASLIARYGEAMTLSRSGETSISLKGKRIGGTVESVGNTAEQQRFRVKISTAELAASAWASKIPSAAGDTLTVGGLVRTVVDVRPLNVGAETAGYELEVAG